MSNSLRKLIKKVFTIYNFYILKCNLKCQGRAKQPNNIMLYISSAVEDGILNFKNSNNQAKEFSAHEKLTVSDIESLAKFAYEKNNFGIAIEIIQSLLQIIPNSKSKINDNFIKNLEK